MEERIIKDINNLLAQLFQKMKEAGYEWDEVKRELKEIEHKVIPKFRVGDRITEKSFDECGCGTIKEIKDGKYIFDDGSFVNIEEQNLWQVIEQKSIMDINPSEKDQDRYELVEKNLVNSKFSAFESALLHLIHLRGGSYYDIEETPSSHFKLDAEKLLNIARKQLVVEQKPVEEVNGEDYGIDGLFAALDILNKTLGQVEDYQSDDGILEHKAAITVVKKLCKQKLEWSYEDENRLSSLLFLLHEYNNYNFDDWLKLLKYRVQPKQEWKPSKEQMKVLDNACNDALGKDYHNILRCLFHDLKAL